MSGATGIEKYGTSLLQSVYQISGHGNDVGCWTHKTKRKKDMLKEWAAHFSWTINGLLNLCTKWYLYVNQYKY